MTIRQTPFGIELRRHRLSAGLTQEELAERAGPTHKRAWRPDGGDFFNQNGLLFLGLDQVKATVAELVKQQTGWPWWAAIAVALLTCAAIGTVVEMATR